MLTWDATKVEKFKEKNEARKGFLDCLIWAMYAIGMNKITPKTVKEITYRIERFRFEGHGLFVIGTEKGMEYMKVEEKDIEQWIGLSTNVCTIGNAAFDKLMRQRTGREPRR